MAIIKRTEFMAALQNSPPPEGQLYLFFGERYLCKTAADSLQKKILANHPGALHKLDDTEGGTAQIISRLMSYSLLPGKQLYRVSDSNIFHTRSVLSDIWEKATEANRAGKKSMAIKHLRALVLAAGLKVSGADVLSDIAAAEWQILLGFDKPGEDISWADKLLEEAGITQSSSPQNLIERFIAAFDKGFPPDNILLLLAETVDKRHRLFKYLKKCGTIVDCSVAAGSNMAAQQAQKSVLQEMVNTTLAKLQKTMDNSDAELFFERVGFHPVAVVTETEKLAHYIGKRKRITRDDIVQMVARTREDALYELTDAFSKKKTGRIMTILSRLLDQGVHGLAILATMRNYVRKQLIFRTLQIAGPSGWRQGMSAKEFQNSYLPALKSSGQWTDLLKAHPYALYLGFSQASGYSCNGLTYWLSLILEAEYRLKGSALPQQLVLEELFFAMLKGRPKVHTR